ncbi:glutathione peroxidase [Gallaecimonas sp. GXIMD4217]|uniref:glutathione peroxidase n=1 Tax=Gallaecimonas sp. GXIMD4217 TaxID=3131927 RepID=UPI00311AF45F
MKAAIAALIALFCFPLLAGDCPAALSFVKRKLNSTETVNLCQAYRDKVVLVVNTASYCGFTPQFEGLEALYQRYRERGLVVLGFPSHDFRQEADDETETAKVCRLDYQVSFPMFEALAVRGDDADPLYRILAREAGGYPKWNFYKYLIGRDGKVIDYYSSFTKPNSDKLRQAIEQAL